MWGRQAACNEPFLMVCLLILGEAVLLVPNPVRFLGITVGAVYAFVVVFPLLAQSMYSLGTSFL